jgi:uncharacterized damage-inducible protein DinB
MLPFYEAFLDRIKELHRDTEKCFSGLPPEGLDWVPGQDMNSLAVLVTHVAGAERYWICDVAGQNPFNRDRDAEFRASGVDEVALKQHLDDALADIEKTLEALTLEDLQAERVSRRNQRTFTVGWSILHAMEHTALHLGHMQMIRQLWDQR